MTANAKQGTVAQWLSLMSSYPRDGWDGAAALIEAHHKAVIALEEQLDAVDPGWYDRLDKPPQRQS